MYKYIPDWWEPVQVSRVNLDHLFRLSLRHLADQADRAYHAVHDDPSAYNEQRQRITRSNMCHNDWIPYKKLKVLIHFNTQSEQTNNVWTNVTWKLVLKWKHETLILDVTTEFKQVDKNMPKRNKTYKYLAKGPRSTWNKVFLIVSKADKSTVLCSLANTHFSSYSVGAIFAIIAIS